MPKPSATLSESTFLKDKWGSVRIYIRHKADCEDKHLPDDEAQCHCAKWLYENKRRLKKPIRRSLNTYSWGEAQKIAQETLESFNPEIAAARKERKQKETRRMTVEDAFKLFYDRKVADLGADSGSLPKYRYFGNKFIRWADAQRTEAIQDIETLALGKWQLSNEWRRLGEKTQAVGWVVLRGMFEFLTEVKVLDENPIKALKAIKASGDLVQGPYTDKQVKAILGAVSRITVPDNIHADERKHFVKRLRAYMLLLLHSGCDTVDAVLFTRDKISKVRVDGENVFVYKYKRKKTGTIAIIPIEAKVAEEILGAPSIPSGTPEMPFRVKDTELINNTHKWGNRIADVIRLAGVDYVILPGVDEFGNQRRKRANAKQFRHTFAVRQLIAGQRPEEVAKMLGHVNTQMLRAHYAPWVPEMDEAHLARVMGVQRDGKRRRVGAK